MALENYRITEFQEKTQVDNGDYVLIDSATDGTHKYQLSRIPAQASAEVAAAVAAEEAAREAADAAEVTARNAAIGAAISDEVTARNAAIAANVDNTLTVSGKAADAKKTGDEIADLKSDLTQLEADLFDQTGEYPHKTVTEFFADSYPLGTVYPPEDGKIQIHDIESYNSWYVTVTDAMDIFFDSSLDIGTFMIGKISNVTNTERQEIRLYFYGSDPVRYKYDNGAGFPTEEAKLHLNANDTIIISLPVAVSPTDVIIYYGAQRPSGTLLNNDIRLNEGQISQVAFGTSVTEFGAKGDGITDDSAAIRAALAYCIDNNRVLRFPEGTFLFKTTVGTAAGMIVSSSAKIEGAGIGKTILKGAASLNGVIHMFRIENADNVEISDLTIDGGLTDATMTTATDGAHGIRIANSTNVRIHDVEIRYVSAYGIGQQTGSSQHVTIENVYIHDTGQDGIDFKNFSSTNADLTINNATIRRVGRRTANQVGIDIRCDGANISNIYVDLPDANNASGIRARTTTELQGTGGKHINISNVIIVGNASNTGEGISANEEGVKIANAKIEKVGIGVRLYNYAPDEETQPTESYGHVTNCNILNCNVNAIRADTNGNAIVNCDIGDMGSGLTAVYLADGAMHSFIGCTFHDCDTLMNIANAVSKVAVIGCEAKNVTTKFSGKTSAIEKIACHGLD